MAPATPPPTEAAAERSPPAAPSSLPRRGAFDLRRFRPPIIPGNRSFAMRLLWYGVSTLLFRSRWPLLRSPQKAAILRSFGARVGKGVVLKPDLHIKYPWFLAIGDAAWLGEGVWIDNPAQVTIGAGTCISQRAYLVTGNHDYRDPAFAYFGAPIEIGEGVWVSAGVLVAPGSRIPSGTVVPIGSVWTAR